MTKLLMIIVAFVFVTLAVVTAVQTVNSPKIPVVAIETRADRRKKERSKK